MHLVDYLWFLTLSPLPLSGQVFSLRAMLAVPYFEKHLYELPEEEVTPAHLVQLAGEVEVDIQGDTLL